MSLALREGVDIGTIGGKGKRAPAMQLTEGAPYEPEITEYIPDPRNDKIGILKKLVEENRVVLRASFALADGRREFIEFDAPGSAHYLRADLVERERIVNRKVLERRLDVASSAAKRLAERNLPMTRENLSITEESALREFRAIETKTMLREGGDGYEERDVVREGWAASSQRALVALRENRAEQFREDDFFDGSFDDADGYYRPWSDREFLPRGSPAFRQQLISDVWDAQAKNYYAWSHDPVIREGCAILTEFPLGRGVRLTAKDKATQEAIDAFWERNRMRRRIRRWANSLSRDGELFIRRIKNGDGTTKLRRLPPETIWEIVTDGEDCEDVYYYVQRYPTRYQLDSAGVPAAQVRYIERTILANEVIHIKINADDDDVRGRSDIFPALGWAKRLRDYWDAEVQKAQAQAAFQYIVKVHGGSGDLSRVMGNIPGTRPQSGSAWVLNDGVDVETTNSGTRGQSGNGSVYEGLINHIALAFGFPKDYFGISSRGSRATALVAADPAAKRFEDRQDIIDDLISQCVDGELDELIKYGKLKQNGDRTYRTIFPAIIKADAKTRAALLSQAKAEGAISHKTFAEELVGELDLEGYEYDPEMSQIKTELGGETEGWQITSKDSISVKRGLPSEEDAAFDPGDIANPLYDGPGAAPPPGTAPGADKASPGSADGAEKIRNELSNEAARRIFQQRGLHEAAARLSAAGAVVILP